MTQLEYALKGIITEQMKLAAKKENVEPQELMHGIASGEIVLPCNVNHKNLSPVAVGKGLFVKVNANIGTSEAFFDVEFELKKLKVAIEAGAHSVMDLSTGGDIDNMRREVIKNSTVMVGTVPLYQVLVEAKRSQKSVLDISADDMFDAIEKHCRDGVDFITVHCGVTKSIVEELKGKARIMDIVSRGGSFMANWILHSDKENPFYEQFDCLLEIAKEYDVTLSLGDGLRPGCIEDATDSLQIKELIVLGSLVKRAREYGVQVMVEGPGHVPMDQIEANVKLEKSLCHGAPFYVLGPIVTDIAPGYDHITSAIGGAIAAFSGADFLCYVTPAEHLGLPNVEDVKEGVIAARIAAHAADIARGIKGAREWDLEMSKARKKLDWQRQIALAIDPERAQAMREKRNAEDQECCTMCGSFCAYKMVKFK
ncbi:phosphomethylpyrimidine synthase ThiC [Peptococcaceae bacterium]|nr:phosphomethylpyrimidine synthase ThiC [Peptococcaceae bacterium]